MTRMNANIILGARQPDLVNALAGGQELRARQNQLSRDNALNEVFQTHGAGILAGDEGALEAYASVDPSAAVTVRGQHQIQKYRAQRSEQDLLEQQMRVEAHIADMDAAEIQREVEMIRRGVSQAIVLAERGDLDGVNRKLMEAGRQPIESLDEFSLVVAEFLDGTDAMEAYLNPPQPLSGPGKVQADIEAGLLPEGTELRSPQVVVNTGNNADDRPIVDKPPKGFQRVWDENSQTYVDKPIPGSDVSQERNSVGRKVELAASDYRRKSDIVNSNIDKAIASIKENGRWVAGYGSLLSGLPESAARDFQATIDTIKANLGFEELQAMKDASPTGGALGQVTEREIAFLQAIQGNLDAAQSPEQLLSVLKEIKKRRAEFAAEREAIMAKDQTAAQAADLSQQVRNLPDFTNMSDDELNAWIQENGNE